MTWHMKKYLKLLALNCTLKISPTVLLAGSYSVKEFIA
jgi:hypothetical protein